METWTFGHVCDMQRGSPRSFRYNPSWNANWHQAREQLLRLQPELLLVGGALTGDGSVHDHELRGYGPGRHPLPKLRDYRLSRAPGRGVPQ